MNALLNPLRMLLLAGLLGTAATGFVLIPPGTTLPIHWGPSGVADGFAPRELALLLPLAMAAFVWGLYVFLPRLARPGDMEAGRRPLAVVLTAITALALLLEVAIVLVGLGVGVNVVQSIALAMGVLLIVLGNAMPKSQPNSVAGIRHPLDAWRRRELAGHAPADGRAGHRRRAGAGRCRPAGTDGRADLVAARVRVRADRDRRGLLADTGAAGQGVRRLDRAGIRS